ncbi:MAG: hypothetical protein LBG72_02400 [Spirochaetaceae bacterium]|jgi:hypothetical protein|nr:hypothetical protein [Spirochaetaceae bacterium]
MPDKKFIADWFRYAKSDLNTSRHMFEDVYPKETELAADEPMVKAAIERAQRIYDFCAAKVNAL